MFVSFRKLVWQLVSAFIDILLNVLRNKIKRNLSCVNRSWKRLASPLRRFSFRIFTLDYRHRWRVLCSRSRDGDSCKRHCHMSCIARRLCLRTGSRTCRIWEQLRRNFSTHYTGFFYSRLKNVPTVKRERRRWWTRTIISSQFQRFRWVNQMFDCDSNQNVFLALRVSFRACRASPEGVWFSEQLSSGERNKIMAGYVGISFAKCAVFLGTSKAESSTACQHQQHSTLRWDFRWERWRRAAPRVAYKHVDVLGYAKARRRNFVMHRVSQRTGVPWNNSGRSVKYRRGTRFAISIAARTWPDFLHCRREFVASVALSNAIKSSKQPKLVAIKRQISRSLPDEIWFR